MPPSVLRPATSPHRARRPGRCRSPAHRAVHDAPEIHHRIVQEPVVGAPAGAHREVVGAAGHGGEQRWPVPSCPPSAKTGVTVTYGRDRGNEFAGGGQATGRARAHVCDPQRDRLRRDQSVDAATEAAAFRAVSCIDLVAIPAGLHCGQPIGGGDRVIRTKKGPARWARVRLRPGGVQAAPRSNAGST